MQRPTDPSACHVSAIRAWLLAILVAIATSSCVMPLSPADLARNENHYYPGRTRAQVYKAAVTALRTTGFQVVVNDEGAGKIKTAPKVITATAYGNSYGAVATENAIAWSIDMLTAPNGCAIHAEPRGYSGGQVLAPDSMNGDYLERLFGTLYGAIDENLPPPPPGAPPPPPR